MEHILEVNKLTKVFKKKGVEFVAVDNISFTLNKGESLGIVGESGSGKTTLVRMITRLLPSTYGEIILNGEDITHIKGRKLRNIYSNMQMVFQSPYDSFDGRHKFGRSMIEPMINNGFSKADAIKRAEQLFERCSLPKEMLDKFPHEVSGGQCQRAGIARAVSISPKLLICDECTSALDVTIQKEIIDLLNEFREEMDMSYLFISHDLGVVQSFCDRAIVMHNGKAVEEGAVDDISNNPQAQYTKDLIDSVL